jgi:hypothetical protein
MPTRSLLFDADGNEVHEEAAAVRGTIVEVDDEDNVVRELDSWKIDDEPDSLPR